MSLSAQRTEDRATRILDTARQIIRETGDFDLPMRRLAASAQVSLRSPYEIFGSKHGVIAAILKQDQSEFSRRFAELKSADALDGFLDRLALSIEFFAAQEAFYRALFRATRGFSGVDGEPARENLHPLTVRARKAITAGVLRPEIDPAIFAETLTDIFASAVRSWASADWDIRLLHLRVGYGYALALAAAAIEPGATRMRERAMEFQAEIQSFG